MDELVLLFVGELGSFSGTKIEDTALMDLRDRCKILIPLLGRLQCWHEREILKRNPSADRTSNVPADFGLDG